MMRRQNYGQDSPGIVRRLAVGGVVLAIMALIVHSIRNRHGLRPDLFWPPAVALLATAMWMIWSSRVGKHSKLRSLLNRYRWRGDEAVLDIGCGSGLATVSAAQRACSGHVVGIDRWRRSDLSSNTPAAARASAQAACVAGRVSFATGDATGRGQAPSH